MASMTVEQARTQVILQNPSLSSAEVRKQADKLIAQLDYLAWEDDLKASYAAEQQAEQAQQAAEAQRRAEAVNDARAIIANSHPDYDAAGIEYAAQLLVAENERALAELSLRESLTES